MTPGNYPLTIYRGDDHAWQFVLWADAGKTTPVDLTGVTVKAEIRDRPGGPAVFELATQITLPNFVDMSFSGVFSRQFPASGRWDLQLIDASGWTSTVLAGAVKVTGDITDSDPDDGAPLEVRREAGYLTEAAP
jgi:hypothetical protein